MPSRASKAAQGRISSISLDLNIKTYSLNQESSVGGAESNLVASPREGRRVHRPSDAGAGEGRGGFQSFEVEAEEGRAALKSGGGGSEWLQREAELEAKVESLIR